MPALSIRGAVKSTMTPPIPKAQAWARHFPATSSRPLLNLSQGVPGEAPDKSVLDKLSSLSKERECANYGPIQGEAVLREAVLQEMRDVYKWDHSNGTTERNGSSSSGLKKENIAISSGCNQAFFIVLSALCQEGDDVIIPCPWYFNMLMTMQLLNINPIPLPLSPAESFTPSPDLAKSLITSNTRAIALVSPNNPCGSVYSPSLLKQFYDIAKEAGIALIVDETYRDFVLSENGEPRGKPHSLFEEPGWSETLISVFSFSKSYKVPGYRLGGIVASENVLEACTTVADCIQICPPRLPQLALAPLLPSLRPSLNETSLALSARLEAFKKLISTVPGWSVSSYGGYFSYVKFPDSYGQATSEEVAERLAKECGVLTLPGIWFMPAKGSKEWKGMDTRGSEIVQDRWIRFAIANVSDGIIKQIPDRLSQLNQLYGDKAESAAL